MIFNYYNIFLLFHFIFRCSFFFFLFFLSSSSVIFLTFVFHHHHNHEDFTAYYCLIEYRYDGTVLKRNQLKYGKEPNSIDTALTELTPTEFYLFIYILLVYIIPIIANSIASRILEE